MTCNVTGCRNDTEIIIHGVHRCWQHYREEMDLAGRTDWRDVAVHREGLRLGLDTPRRGENLSDYMRRHGVGHYTPERVPGSDDDL